MRSQMELEPELEVVSFVSCLQEQSWIGTLVEFDLVLDEPGSSHYSLPLVPLYLVLKLREEGRCWQLMVWSCCDFR